MKDRALSSNAYSLLLIGSTMVVDGGNLRLGLTYVGLGLLLFTVEVWMKKEENKCDHKDEKSSN